jgi:hypothetical protein
MFGRSLRGLRLQYSMRTLLAFFVLFAAACSWLKVSLSGANGEQQAARLIQGEGGIVLRRAAPWWNARRWMGLAFGHERWSFVDELWCGYGSCQSNPQANVPVVGVWPNPLIASTLPRLSGSYRLHKGVVAGDGVRNAWARIPGDCSCLRSLPWARRVGLTGTTDAELANLAPLRGLCDLELSDTGVIGQGLSHLTTLPQLRRLQLLDVPLDAAGKQHLATFQNLEELIIWEDDYYANCEKPRPERETADTLGHEKGTSLILTGWARRDSPGSCREQPDPPKREWSTTFSIEGTGECGFFTKRRITRRSIACSRKDWSVTQSSC